jgi:hypothetical protein
MFVVRKNDPTYNINSSSVAAQPERNVLRDKLSKIAHLDDLGKVDLIKSLTPKQRTELAPEHVKLFYNAVLSSGELKINRAHLPETLKKLPCIIKSSEKVDYAELLTLFDNFYVQDPHTASIVDHLAVQEPDLESTKKLRKGLEGIISSVKEFEEQGDKLINALTYEAIKDLLILVLDCIKSGKLNYKTQAEYYRDLALGGINCHNGQFIQMYKVYLKVIGCNSAYERTLKFLHDLRDNITDELALKRKCAIHDDKSESVEDKQEIIRIAGKDLGLLAYQAILAEGNPIDYSRLHERQYVDTIIARWRASKNSDSRISIMLKHIYEDADERVEILQSFDHDYTVSNILNLLQAESRDLDLVEWFLQNPPSHFEDNPHYFDFVLKEVLLDPSEYIIHKEFLCLMLENMGVFKLEPT